MFISIYKDYEGNKIDIEEAAVLSILGPMMVVCEQTSSVGSKTETFPPGLEPWCTQSCIPQCLQRPAAAALPV